MSIEPNKQVVLTMLKDGSYLNPDVLTEDFTYTGVGNPKTLRGAGVPQSADKVIQGRQKARELFRHPDGEPTASRRPVGLRAGAMRQVRLSGLSAKAP